MFAVMQGKHIEMSTGKARLSLVKTDKKVTKRVRKRRLQKSEGDLDSMLIHLVVVDEALAWGNRSLSTFVL